MRPLKKQMDMSKDNKSKKNKMAHDFLIQSTKDTFLHVSNAEGRAFKAWNSLEKECGMKSSDCAALSRKFADCDLESSHENPCEWFNCMVDLKNKIKKVKPTKTLDNKDLMNHVIVKIRKRPEHKHTVLGCT